MRADLIMNSAITNKKIKIKTEFLTQIKTKMAKYKEIFDRSSTNELASVSALREPHLYWDNISMGGTGKHTTLA